MAFTSDLTHNSSPGVGAPMQGSLLRRNLKTPYGEGLFKYDARPLWQEACVPAGRVTKRSGGSIPKPKIQNPKLRSSGELKMFKFGFNFRLGAVNRKHILIRDWAVSGNGLATLHGALIQFRVEGSWFGFLEPRV